MKVGDEYVQEHLVTSDYFASKWGSGGLDVFATPCMIAMMEGVCLQLVQKSLTDGQTTVGTSVNVQHLKPTGLGQRVRFHAKLTAIDGNRLSFDLEAFDEDGLIGKGVHERAVIDVARFMQKLNAKP